MLNTNFTLLALYATLFTWLLTILGSSLVFFFKKSNKTQMDTSLSIAAGIMLSASFFSLLNPAFNSAKLLNQKPWLVISIGFLLGCLFILLADRIYSKKQNKRTPLLIMSITMHNIPEGLAVGIAFGSVKYGINGVTLISAIMLAIAIGLQNFPEGAAISLPLRRDGYTRYKSFLYGSLSAIVEPIFGIIGALITVKISYLMPTLLSFASGAMIYVIVKELIPESQNNKHKSLMTLLLIIGFLLMMILDTIM